MSPSPLPSASGTPTEPPVGAAAPMRPFRLVRWTLWLVVVLLAFAIAWLNQRILVLKATNQLQQDERHFAELELRNTRQRAEAQRLLMERQLTDLRRELAQAVERLALANTRAADTGRELGDAQRQLAARQADLAEIHAELAQTATRVYPAPEPPVSPDLAGLQIAVLSARSDTASEARAIAIWHPNRQEIVLRVEHLPALPADQHYQLWISAPGSIAPISAGVFGVRDSGPTQVHLKLSQPLGAVDRFTVTAAHEGGASQPSGPTVLVSD